MAAAVAGLMDVQHLARTGPQDLGHRLARRDRHGRAHDRHGIHAGVGDAPGEHRDDPRRVLIQGVDRADHLFKGQDGGDVQLYALMREVVHQWQAAVALGVGDGDLDVDVGSPRGDLQRLAAHIVEVVREDLEGDRQVGDDLDQLAGEGFIVGHMRAMHQGGVGGETGHPALGLESRELLEAGAIAEQLDAPNGCRTDR